MTSKLTREQLHERARENVKALKMASRQTAFGSIRDELLADLQLAEYALAALDSEPVAYMYDGEDGREYNGHNEFSGGGKGIPLYRHAQQSVVPENRVTAEHRRVIEMLLNVCGAAFELADDSCQQDIDGEECHVVPDDAFQKLSDALDEIENTLQTEDIDRPDVFLAWSAMPRAALKSLLQAGNSPVIPDGYVMVPKEPTEEMNKAGWAAMNEHDAINPTYRAMLAAAPAGIPMNSTKWIPVSERMPETDGNYWGWWSESKRQGPVWFIKSELQAQFQSHEITHWMTLPAAPQEVR